MHDRDGVDDFYEPFFNWPVLYKLGGSSDLLPAVKHHWEGVTAQMTEFGFVRDEFELGYDWFHQGESLNFFYALCAADPEDPQFRDRAKRFARLYLASSPLGNYNSETKTIVAAHTGSGGPRWGVGDDWLEYRADQAGMKPYGLPLQDLPGINSWADLEQPGASARMGAAMQARLGVGDTAINLAATSLVTNAWLYDNEREYSQWVDEYVGAWRERAAANNGLIPDNVGPTGIVGELHEGRWYGGHYGWLWPHGLHSVEAGAMIAAINSTIISGSNDALELPRGPLDTVIENGKLSKDDLDWGWSQKMAVPEGTEMLVVPFRFGPEGWFDYHPVPLVYPVWMWWLTFSDADRGRLDALRERSGFDWTETKWFQDKEEQGHEAPWLSYLLGSNPSYPEDALELALGQVNRRLALMRESPFGPPDDDIHWWQRLNPVVTEVLTQLINGAPPALYNGGLGLTRLSYGDAMVGRPGLPPGVAALVSDIDEGNITLELANLDPDKARIVLVQAGAFGEDRIDQASFDHESDFYPGDSRSYNIPDVSTATTTTDVGASTLLVELPALTRITIRLSVTRRAYVARHQNFTNQRNQEN